MKIAGLDIGTTGCKCTVFSESGNYLNKAYRDYPAKRAVSGHEMDVSAMLEGVYAVIREMSQEYPDIGGLGVTSFGETFVITDEYGMSLYPAMLDSDPRGREECDELRGKLGGKEIAAITGLRAHEAYSLPKLLWLKHHEPDIFGKARYIMLMQDYIVYHLTGKRQIDYSLASRTMAFDIRSLTWSKTMLDAAGISEEMLAEPVPTGMVAGAVTLDASKKTGLPLSCQVVSISHDQVAAAVGAGVFDSDTAVDGAGTVECVTPVFDGLPDIDVMYNGHFSIVPYVIPGKYVTYAWSYTGGALLKWCVDTMAKKEKELAQERGVSVNVFLEEAYRKDAPTGLLVLPHFAGAATPYMDTDAKGAFIGLTLDTSVAELYRACMEGVVYEMLINYEALAGSGVHFKRLCATGGGARSREWMQMKADMLNLPVVALKTADAGTVGSAMLTGVATWIFTDLNDAATHMVEEAEMYLPRERWHKAYMEIFARYKRLYSAVRPLE